jgi:hypothetical protein
MKTTVIFLFLMSTLSSGCSLGVPDKENLPGDLYRNQYTNDSIPILLLGSFLNLNDNYSNDSIRSGLIEKKISCTHRLSEYLQNKYSLPSKPKEINLCDFDLKDENSLVFTEIDSVEPRFSCKSINKINFFSNPESYPLWKEVDNRNFDFKKEITHYIHTGVTAITRSTGLIIEKQGMDWYLSNIEPFFKHADIIHISNEVSIADTCNYSTMKMKFATRTSHFEALNRLNVSVVELTGNHNLDFGTEAYLKSLEWYQNNNINYFGGGRSAEEASKPLVKKLKNGDKIAWIGFNELCPLGECTDIKKMGAQRYNESRARIAIDSLKKKVGVKYILACVQFREMDSYTPNAVQQKISRDLIDFGADVVLGSQAHQAQEIAIYKGKPIFYGLGNFLFDQIHRIGVRQAFFLNCYIFNGKIIQFQPIYTFMKSTRQPSIASPEDKKLIQTSILKKTNF